MKRLFFALWPDEATRRQCCYVIEKIVAADAKPVAAKNLHATLLFLGGIDSAQEMAITDAADALSVLAMELTFDELSYWKKPQILCLTSRHFDQSVAVLAGQLAAIAIQYGVTVDERPFKPHITLARKAKAPAEIEFQPVLWRADSFCLVESCSDKDGVEYRVIRRWSVAPSGLDTSSSN